MSQVKGTKIKSKITFLRDEYGEAMVDQVLASLSPTDRSHLGAMVDLGWYEMALYERLVGAIVRVAADGDEKILDRIGRYGAEDLSRHAYKAYYRSGDPETVLSKMIPIHESLNDPGEMEIVKDRQRELRILVSEPRGSQLNCRVARAFYERSVELCGVSAVAVEEARCSANGAPLCEFRVSWEE